MEGSVKRSCSCPKEYDAQGKPLVCTKRHGSWSYVLDVGRDPVTKRRRQERRRGFKTRAEAQSTLAARIVEIEAGQYTSDQKMTLAQYLDRWIKAKESGLRATTIIGYRRHIENYLKPGLGDTRLRNLRTRQVNDFLRSLHERPPGQGRVGAPTIVAIHRTLRSALSDAVREDLITTNVAKNATVPVKPRRKVNPWQPAEVGVFLDAAANHRFGPYFEVLALSGLRRGEAAGLRWRDVDLAAGVLVVRQQILDLNAVCPLCGHLHKGAAFGPPKTTTGEDRRVELGARAVAALIAHRSAQGEDKEAWGGLYRDHDLVFALENGDPVPPERFTKAFERLAAQAGLRHARLHDLRHARASMLLASGTDIALVSKMLGHSSITITTDTYAHMLPGIGQQAADAADALITRGPRDQSVTSPPVESTEAPS